MKLYASIGLKKTKRKSHQIFLIYTSLDFLVFRIFGASAIEFRDLVLLDPLLWAFCQGCGNYGSYGSYGNYGGGNESGKSLFHPLEKSLLHRLEESLLHRLEESLLHCLEELEYYCHDRLSLIELLIVNQLFF